MTKTSLRQNRNLIKQYIDVFDDINFTMIISSADHLYQPNYAILRECLMVNPIKYKQPKWKKKLWKRLSKDKSLTPHDRQVIGDFNK